jgi:hypothetical protein
VDIIIITITGVIIINTTKPSSGAGSSQDAGRLPGCARSLSAVCCLLSTVCYLLSAVCCLLPDICCLLSARYQSLMKHFKNMHSTALLAHECVPSPLTLSLSSGAYSEAAVLEFFELRSCLLSAVCFAVCCPLSAVCCLLSAVCRLLSAVCSLLSAVCCLLSAVCCLLSAVCCLRYLTYLPLSAVRGETVTPVPCESFNKVRCLLPATVYCLLSAVCCLPSDV